MVMVALLFILSLTIKARYRSREALGSDLTGRKHKSRSKKGDSLDR